MSMPAMPSLNHSHHSVDPSDVDKYGYGSGSPTVASRPHYEYDSTRVPRRSSLKGGSGSRPMNRRASIGSTSTMVVEVRKKGGERVSVQRRRSIDFNNTVEVKEVVPVTEYSTQEELWLQPEDFAKMKSERRRLVQKHKQGKAQPQSNPDEDIRGLEKYLDGNVKIMKNRAWDTVLLEQDEQELTGDFNDQRIADLYRDSTFKSPEKAAALAKQDYEAVRDYLTSPKTTKLMMRRCSC